MIPGMGRMNPRQMKQAMKRLGIKSEEISDVEEVIIRTATKEYIIKPADVTMMEVQNQKTFQVVGEPEIVARTEEGKTAVPLEDVKLVAEQTGVSEEEARKALEECGGEPAEAIIKLMG